MPNVNLAPTDYSTEYANILRQQKMAELMQKQSMQPLEAPPNTAQGWAIKTSPFSAMAKMLQGYAGGVGQNQAIQRQVALAQRMRGEAQGYMNQMPQGTPGTPATPDSYSGEAGTSDELFHPGQAATPDVSASRQQLLAHALRGVGSGNPLITPMATKVAEEYMKPVSQDALLRRQTTLETHNTPSAGALLSEQGAQKRFEGVSGGTQATLAQTKELHDLDRNSLSANQQAQLNVSLAHLGIAQQTLAEGRVQLMTDQAGNIVAVNKTSKATVPIIGPDGQPLKGKEANITETQGKANLYQSRATEAAKTIDEMQGKYSPAAISTKQGVGKVWGVGGILEAGGNALLPKNAQNVEQAQRNFVNAILRQESGSAIAESEFTNAQKQYFPQAGDAPQVIAQKKVNRDMAIEGLRVMAGPAMKRRSSDQSGGTLKFDAQGNSVP